MAITAATTLSGFSGFLNPEQSAPIFERAARISAVQRLGRQVPLGITGRAIPVVGTKPTASWVAEGAQKPATQGTMTLQTMSPKKLACILVVSAEVVRANPGGFLDQMRTDTAEAFATAFDNATLHGTSTPFAAYIDQTTKSVELGTTTQANGGMYGDVVAGLTLLANAGKRLTGFALDAKVEPLLLGQTDTAGRPLFVDTPPIDTFVNPTTEGRMIGRPTYMSEGISTATSALGYGGDWTQVAWGVVGGINYDISTEATVTVNGALVSLFENNLVAVRAEAEYGFICNDTAAFVKYANAT